MPDSAGQWDIYFEAMGKDQLPFIEKLRKFASDRGFQSQLTTYGNKPNFTSDKPAPVLHIQTKLSLEAVAKLGEDIELGVFKNDLHTVYEVVP